MTTVTLYLDASGLNDWVSDPSPVWVRSNEANKADVERLRADGFEITTLTGFDLDRWGINDMVDDIELHHEDLVRLSIVWRTAGPGEKAALSAALRPRKFAVDWV